MSRPCPVTRDKFMTDSKAIKITVNGVDFWAEPKEFSSGSFGWQSATKVAVPLPDGTLLHLQVGLNATVIGSKEAPRT